LVAFGKIDASKIVKEQVFDVILDKPVQLETNREYALVISVNDNSTQTAIAFSESDIFSNGKMHKFTRVVGGNGEIIDNNHSWQPENSQDIPYSFKGL